MEKTVEEQYDSCRISVCPAALKTYKDNNSQTDQFICFIFVTEVPSETQSNQQTAFVEES